MHCAYCDTPSDGPVQEMTLRSVIDRISDLNKDDVISTISLTGGEPLLYFNFLKFLIPPLREKRYRIYLDTNGILPDKIKEIIGLLDVVAMDIKLPSSTKDKPFWDEHREFLAISRLKEVFVKSVITSETSEGDLNRAVNLVESIDKNIPFILQPASAFKDFNAVPEISVLEKWQRAANSKLKDVRIIPQLHKKWGVD